MLYKRNDIRQIENPYKHMQHLLQSQREAGATHMWQKRCGPI